MKFRSLHSRVNIALIILALALLTQLYTARSSLTVLSDNQNLLIRSYDNVSLIYELERDVIDLQRNLLIYKETASDSSIHRFNAVLESIEGKINYLSENIDAGDEYQIDKDMFKRMVKHIQDYEENFGSVIMAREKQKDSIKHIDVELDNIQNQFELVSYKIKNNVKIKTLFIEIKQSIHSYVKSLDPEDSAAFNNKVDEMLVLLTKEDLPASSIVFKDIKKDFRRLIQLNRGYLYLVNVVMAGSANEFLFLTKKMREQASKNQDEISTKTGISSKRIQNQYAIVSIISILIIIVIAVFLSNKLLAPIRTMTNVFIRLSKGEEIEGIPYVHRRDEIGDLAKSAEVFHQNNMLTKDLLVQSQDMIANQEVLNIQLENEKEKAELAAKSKSMFLANMSHEIRTPMNGIVGLVDLMKKTKIDEKQRSYLDKIAYSGQIMMNVINDILDFSKIEAGKMEIEKIKFNINSIIENVISSMLVRVNEKQLNFQIWVSDKVPKKLIGDPLRISQILLNLCSNSIKFTDKGDLLIRFDYKDNSLKFSVCDTGIGMSKEQLATIFESFTQADGSISRKYGGTGLGLTIVDQLVGLMQGSIQVESELNKGTQIHVNIQCPALEDSTAALKLEFEHLCYMPKSSVAEWIIAYNNQHPQNIKIVTDSSGKKILCEDNETDLILFEGLGAMPEDMIKSALYRNKTLGCILNSNEGTQKPALQNLGDIKILQHPFSPQQCQNFFNELFDKYHNIKEEEKEIETVIQLNGHLLLVEDNPINQVVAGDMLDTLGLTYETAENGLEAIDKVTSHAYDLVLMDVQMPKMDGYTATQALREKGFKDLVICGLSANALKEDLEKARQSGMSDYLTKPLVMGELQKVLQRYL